MMGGGLGGSIALRAVLKLPSIFVFPGCVLKNPFLLLLLLSGMQVLLSATEAAEMILRVDDIVRCAPRQRG